MKPECITGYKGANEQLLYFTSTSLLKDDKGLFFISERTGNPNIFFRNLKTGEERQLTDNEDGTLKSYVYFSGHEHKGLGKASISLDPESGKIYYIHGRNICCSDMSGGTRVLARVPEDQVTAFTHVSADGKRLCIPTTDARALEGNTRGHLDYDIDKRVREENLNSYLRVYDTHTGKELFAERVLEAWITHVQFCPTDSNLILYNHEWPSHCGIRRMWLWDGKTHIRLRDEAEGRSRNDWTCHEMWGRNGEEIIYHGAYHNGAPYVGKLELSSKKIIEIGFQKEYRKYGHFTVSNDNRLVSDGYYQEAGDENKNAEYISIQKIDWDNRKIEWIPLCRHNSSWLTQDCHPHPIYNHTGDSVYFTSDMDGYCAVYRVDVP